MQMEDTVSRDFQTMKAAMMIMKLLVFPSYRDNPREAYKSLLDILISPHMLDVYQ